MEKNQTEPRTSSREAKHEGRSRVHILEQVIRELYRVGKLNSDRLAGQGKPAFQPRLDEDEQRECDRILEASA